MGDNEKLIAACWVMYGAIKQASANDGYNTVLSSLSSIAESAMSMAGQLEGYKHAE